MTKADAASIASTAVKAAEPLAKKNSSLAGAVERFDSALQLKMKKVSHFHFRDNDDIMKRFPYPHDPLLHYDEKHDLFTYNNRIIVTLDIRDHILEEEFQHVPSSIGRMKWAALLRESYLCIGERWITKFLNANAEHQIHFQRKRSQRSKSTVATGPYKQFMMDITFLQRGRVVGLLVCVDLFSKFAWVEPLVNKESKTILTAWKKMAQTFKQKPGLLRTDNGKEFEGVFAEHLQAEGIKVVKSQPYTPTSQGAVEVLNRVIKSYLTSTQPDQTVARFSKSLAIVLKTYNNSKHGATGWNPAQLNDPNLPAVVVTDVLGKLRKLAEGTEPNKRYLKAPKPGDLCRLDNVALDNELAAAKKSGVGFKSSHMETFSREVYHVQSFSRAKASVKIIEFPKHEFSRGQVLLIDKDTVLNDDHEPQEPTEGPTSAQIFAERFEPRVTRQRASESSE